MKSVQTENRILKETGVMFFRHGIRTITMDDIASSLGMSKKTIYLYYRDKAQLVQSFTDIELQNQEREMKEIRARSVNAIDEILHVMNHLSNFFKRVNPAVFYDLQKYHPESWNSFKRFKEKTLIGFVEENLRTGIHEELYRKELKIKILARLRIEEVEMGFNPAVYAPEKFRITDVQLALIDHFLHGIITIKGFKLIDRYKRNQKKNH
jgi:AcrR family transcriptional regulator